MIKLYNKNCIDVLDKLEKESASLIVTSPHTILVKNMKKNYHKII